MRTKLRVSVVFIGSLLCISLWQATLAAREWVDTTGKFRIEAEFVELEGTQVILKTPAGKTLKVPLEKLREADRKFLRSLVFGDAASKADVEKAKQLIDEAMVLLDVDPRGNAGQIDRKLKEASKLNPTDIRGEFLCGIFNLLLAADPIKAARHFEACDKQRPHNVAVLSNLALSHVKGGKHALAVKNFEAAAKLAPGLPAITQNLGRALKVHNDGRLKMPAKTAEDYADLYASLVASKKFPASRPQMGWLLVNIKLEDIVDTDVDEADEDESTAASALPPNVIGGGTGFVVQGDYIVTNRHVVGEEKEVLIRVPGRDELDGGLLRAKVLAVSDAADIAVVHCAELRLPAVQIVAQIPRRGSDVMVLGFPQFSQLGATIKSTRGAITSLPAAETENMMLLDAEMNSGNSGGPVANKQGQVVAVATAVFKPIGGTGGKYGAGVPIADQMPFLRKHIPNLAATTKVGADLEWPDVDERVSRSTVLVLITGSEDEESEEEAAGKGEYAGLMIDPTCPACNGAKSKRGRTKEPCPHCRGLGLDREAVMQLAELLDAVSGDDEDEPPPRRTTTPRNDPPVTTTRPSSRKLPEITHAPGNGGDNAGRLETTTVKTYRAPRGEVIDLIALAQVEDFHPAQKWQKQGGKLLCPEGNFVPKVMFPINVPEEYDLQVVVTQHKLRNGIGLIVPNGHGASLAWLTGSGGGQDTVLSGKEYTAVYRQRDLIRVDATYEFTLCVRRDRMEGYINGKRVFSYVGNRAALATNTWHRLPDVERIGICCDDPATFHAVRFLEVKSN